MSSCLDGIVLLSEVDIFCRSFNEWFRRPVSSKRAFATRKILYAFTVVL